MLRATWKHHPLQLSNFRLLMQPFRQKQGRKGRSDPLQGRNERGVPGQKETNLSETIAKIICPLMQKSFLDQIFFSNERETLTDWRVGPNELRSLACREKQNERFGREHGFFQLARKDHEEGIQTGIGIVITHRFRHAKTVVQRGHDLSHGFLRHPGLERDGARRRSQKKEHQLHDLHPRGRWQLNY